MRIFVGNLWLFALIVSQIILRISAEHNDETKIASKIKIGLFFKYYKLEAFLLKI